MKEGMLFGAVLGLLVYLLVPIYSTDGVQANLLPTGNVVSDITNYNSYVANLPFSMIVFVSLEILGMGIGVIGQWVLRHSYTMNRYQ